MVVMDQIGGGMVTHVHDVRHHANYLEKIHDNTNLRSFWIHAVISTDTTKKIVRCAHSVTHSYGKCTSSKPIAGSSFFPTTTVVCSTPSHSSAWRPSVPPW
jgi:hypothetical protein